MNTTTTLTCDSCGTQLRAPVLHPELLSTVATASDWIMAYPYGNSITQTKDLCPECQRKRDRFKAVPDPMPQKQFSCLNPSHTPASTAECCNCGRQIPTGFLFSFCHNQQICIDCQADLYC